MRSRHVCSGPASLFSLYCWEFCRRGRPIRSSRLPTRWRKPAGSLRRSSWLAQAHLGRRSRSPTTASRLPSFSATWKVDRKSKKLDEHRTAHTVVYSDPAGGLSVRCEAVEYDDYPTVEWTLHFKNTGAADTPIIENIQSLDVRWQRGGDGEFLLHHNVGSPHDGTDYAPRETVLTAGANKRIAAAGGRSTWTDLSYFNLERSKDEGLIVVVGWPGQWAADFVRDGDAAFDLLRGPGTDAFQAASERRDPHAAFGASVLERRRLDPLAKRLAAMDDRPQYPASRRQTAQAAVVLL